MDIEHIANETNQDELIDFVIKIKKDPNKALILAQVLEQSIEKNNLKPVQIIIQMYTNNENKFVSTQMDVASHIVAKNKSNLIEKALLGQLTTVNELLRESMMNDNVEIFDYICTHEDIVVLPNLVHKLTMLAYLVDSFFWVEKCEKQMGYENYRYKPQDEEQLIQFTLQKQSIQGLEHLIHHHNVNVSEIFDIPSVKYEGNTKFLELFVLATQEPDFYNHSVSEQINFIEYLLNQGVNQNELINYYFYDFHEKQVKPNQQTFNEISFYFLDNNLTTIAEIRNKWKSYLNANSIDTLIAEYELIKLDTEISTQEKATKIKL